MRTSIVPGISLLILSFCGPAASQDKGVGFGVILGEPTGISAKGWTSVQNAFDVGLAWSFRGEGSVHIHADYLWHFERVFQSSERFPLYVGIGGRLATRGETVFGVRVPLGIAWWPREAPIDVFLELVPIVDLAPETELSGNGGIGVRYFFP